MSERNNDDWFAWTVVLILILSLFAYIKINESEIRDLQRRVGQLESRK